MDVLDRLENVFIGLILIFLGLLIPTTVAAATTTHLYKLEKNGAVDGYVGVEVNNAKKSVIIFNSRGKFQEQAATVDVLDAFSGEKQIILDMTQPQKLTKMKYGPFSWEVSLSEIGNEVRIVTDNDGKKDELFIYPVLPTYDTLSLLFSLGRHHDKSFDFYYLEEKHQKKMFAKYENRGRWSIRFSGREIFAVHLDEQNELPAMLDFHRSVVGSLHPYKLSYLCSRAGGLVCKKKIDPRNVLKDVLVSPREKVPWLKSFQSDAAKVEFKKNRQGSYGLHAEKITLTGNVKDIVTNKLLSRLGIKQKEHGYDLKVQKKGGKFSLTGVLPLIFSRKEIESECPGLAGVADSNIQVSYERASSLKLDYQVAKTSDEIWMIPVVENLRRFEKFRELRDELLSFSFKPVKPEIISRSHDGKILLASREDQDFEFVIKPVVRRPNTHNVENLKGVLFDWQFLRNYIKGGEYALNTKFFQVRLDESELRRGKLNLFGVYRRKIFEEKYCNINIDKAFRNKYGISSSFFIKHESGNKRSKKRFVVLNFFPKKSLYLETWELEKILKDKLYSVMGNEITVSNLHVDEAFNMQAKISLDINPQGLPASFQFPADSKIKKQDDGALQVEYVNLQTCQ